MEDIAGYRILDVLHDSAKSKVYRAVRLSDQKPVILKLPTSEFLNFYELLKFRNQYNITNKLNSLGIVKPLAIERYRNKLLLLMPDTQSVDLQSIIDQSILPLNAFFDIAISLTKILAELYQNQIIHKDIKPKNILIQPKTNLCQLIDFSISTKLLKEEQVLKSLNVLDGTLAYMPPEQTGRMNRGIDHRSDYYSLGITFYQMLTGILPFTGEDAMEIVHCHLAKQPIPPQAVNKDIPEPLSNLILKLMKKNAENRYQSAEGLLNDLVICQTQWLNQRKIPPFTLGQYDIAKKFVIPEKLYGRKNEVNTLLDTFDKVTNGQPMMLLVTGQPGIGKTVLVNEIQRSVLRERGLFIKGKYDQYNRNSPFLALTQALRMLILQLMNQHNERVEVWRVRISKALGKEAQVLIDLIPELEWLIGKQHSAAQLEGDAEITRFHQLFFNLIHSVTIHQPMVMFIDDLQWMDAASTELLPLLFDTKEAHSFLLIGAYREQEITVENAWFSTLQHFKQMNLPIEKIALSHLSLSTVQQMMQDACLCQNEMAQDLAKLVQNKTEGNPFYIHRLIAVFNEINLVKYDFNAEQWQFDLTNISQLTANKDIVAFMVGQIEKIAENTQIILQRAACIGNEFDLKSLSIIVKKSPKECAKILWAAMKADLIITLNSYYKLFIDEENNDLEIAAKVIYRFTHDRIQQAAYTMISDNLKAVVHLEIGTLLRQQYQADMSEQAHLLDITNHLNLGRSLIISPEKQLELAHINYKSSKKARESMAYKAALNYCQTGLSLFAEDCWQKEYELALALHIMAAEVAFLLGDYPLMNTYKNSVIDNAHSILDAFPVHYLYCSLLVAKSEYSDSIIYSLDLLKQLGISLPSEVSDEMVNVAYEQLQKLLHKTDFLQLDVMHDEKKLAASRLLILVAVGAHGNHHNLFFLITIKSMEITLKYGISSGAIVMISAYGQILISYKQDIENGYYYGQIALKLLTRHRYKAYVAQVTACTYATVTPWKEAFKNTLKPSYNAYISGFETGDYYFSGICISGYSMIAYYSGQELLQISQRFIDFRKVLLKMKQVRTYHWHNIITQVIFNLLGQSTQVCLLQGDIYDEEKSLAELIKNDDHYALCSLYLHKMILGFLFEDKGLSQQALEQAESYLLGVLGTINTAIFHFYAALILTEQYTHSNSTQQSILSEKITKHLEKMKQWAQHAPMNFQHKYDLMVAEHCRIRNAWIEAEYHYEKAIQGAHNNEFIQEEALACELAAKFFMQRDNQTIFEAYISKAYYAYAHWGAKAKTDHLEQQYPEILANIINSSIQNNASQTETSQTTDQLELSSILKLTQTLSSELNLSNFLERLLNIVMENAGAERSLLLIKDDDTWLMAAECQMDGLRRILPGITLADYRQLPQSLINYVITKKQLFLLENAHDKYQRFHADPYFKGHNVKSILCQPILLQAKLMGVLYLENTLTYGAFNNERLQVLEMLSSQVAISIENAHVYKTLEEKVNKRTEELKAAQAELLNQAKEAGMAEIAIGVMHNIGNALTPAKIRVSTLRKQLLNSPLRTALAEALVAMPEIIRNTEILEETEKNRLSRLLQILPHSITTEFDFAVKELGDIASKHDHIEKIIYLQMKYAKARKISEPFQFESLANDAVQMLSDTLKKYDIKIMTDYDKISAMIGDEVKLLQILINIIKNGCEAMADIASADRTLTLTIITDTHDENYMLFKVQDNGIGFSASGKEKLFNFGYTTKNTGLGFGLHACANDIAAMGGSIEGESDGPDLGALFIIRMPMVF